jgi:putative ABC transport system ATP-binding protein
MVFRRKQKQQDDNICVRIQNLHRSFGQGEATVRVLQGLDLTVERGMLIALYGPSGSGKTTLLNVIGALDRPNSGVVEVNGRNIVKLSDGARARMRRREIGFIFQSYTLISTYTAMENIDLALRLPRLNYFERRKRAKTALDAVGLHAWADHVPDELSGGQRQRVAIARALALRPSIILADEPTSGLDTRTARRVMSLFRGIAEAQKTTFIIVSHDPMITEFVNVAYDLHEGRLKPRTPHTASESTSEPVPQIQSATQSELQSETDSEIDSKIRNETVPLAEQGGEA